MALGMLPLRHKHYMNIPEINFIVKFRLGVRQKRTKNMPIDNLIYQVRQKLHMNIPEINFIVNFILRVRQRTTKNVPLGILI